MRLRIRRGGRLWPRRTHSRFLVPQLQFGTHEMNSVSRTRPGSIVTASLCYSHACLMTDEPAVWQSLNESLCSGLCNPFPAQRSMATLFWLISPNRSHIRETRDLPLLPVGIDVAARSKSNQKSLNPRWHNDLFLDSWFAVTTWFLMKSMAREREQSLY